MGNEPGKAVCEFQKCQFDWDQYRKTLERFDGNIKETEKRLQDQITEMKDRLKNVEQTVPEKRLRILEEAILEFIPEQKTLLTQLKDGQDALQRLIGGLSDRIHEHEKKLAEHSDKLIALQTVSDTETARLAGIKHSQWKDKFKIKFASVLMTLWAIDMFIVRRLIVVGDTAEPTWYMWVVLSAVAFLFGESAIRKGVSVAGSVIPQGNGSDTK
jgi:hypothetical protein